MGKQDIKKTWDLNQTSNFLKTVRIIATFIYRQLIKHNLALFTLVAVVGTTSRILQLMSFVAGLKGILIAINPAPFTEIVNMAVKRLGITTTFTIGDVTFGVAAIVVAITVAAVLCSQLRATGVRILQRQFLDRLAPNPSKLNYKRDKFLIDKGVSSIDATLRLLEIFLFCSAVGIMIAIVSPFLLAITFPVVSLIPLAVIVAQRRRLRLGAEMRDAKLNYQLSFPKSAASEDEVQRWIHSERSKYVTTVLQMQKYKLAGTNVSQAMLGAGLVAFIIFLPGTSVKSSDILSIQLPTIFIVLALRQLLSYANAFGGDLSKLLELRSGIKYLEQ